MRSFDTSHLERHLDAEAPNFRAVSTTKQPEYWLLESPSFRAGRRSKGKRPDDDDGPRPVTAISLTVVLDQGFSGHHGGDGHGAPGATLRHPSVCGQRWLSGPRGWPLSMASVLLTAVGRLCPWGRRGAPAARLGTPAGQRVQPARGHWNAVDRPKRRPGHITATRPPAGSSWRACAATRAALSRNMMFDR